MIGLIGSAKTRLTPHGKIFVQGEIWNAISSTTVSKGEPIQVTRVDGLTVHVKPVNPQNESE